MNIKEKIKQGQLVSGFWVQSGSPVVAEIMCHSSVDFVVLDMEHGDASESTLTHFLRALDSRTAPETALGFVRVRENDTIIIRRALDSGAQGVIVPLVNNAAQAQKAVAACKYPPLGKRGYAFCRANQWGRSFDSYAENFNDECVVFVMIESREAVENIDEILAVPGVDGILIGPYDLSGSYNVPGQLAHPAVTGAKASVLAACKKAGKTAGQHLVRTSHAEVQQAIQEGYRFLALGMDTVFIADGVEKYSKMLESASGV